MNKIRRRQLTGSLLSRGLNVFVSRLDQAAEYRRRAKEARETAAWIALNDIKHQLLEMAENLEVLAEIEEREMRKVAPIQAPQLKP